MDNQTGSDVDPSSRKSLAVDYGGMMVKSRCRFYERIFGDALTKRTMVGA